MQNKSPEYAGEPTLSNLTATSIDGVIQSLTKVIEWSKAHKSRLGYFAALYRKVTIRVKEGIENGEFENGERMAQLDVLFANRYLYAVEQYHAAGDLTHSWRFAFDAAKKWRPIVFQHLLAGMHTHIDLDLGIAAAETVVPHELPELKHDFYKINGILASLVDEVQEELAEIWPLFRLLDRFAGEGDEALANFGMKLTRGHAWQVAESLAPLPPEQRLQRIRELDGVVTELGRALIFRGVLAAIGLILIRFGELRSVPRIIEILS